MIPRYRGKITGGRPAGHRRRRRLAIAIEVVRFLGSLVLLYLAFVCAFGLALALASMLGNDISGTVATIPIVRQVATEADLLSRYGAAVLPIGLALALAMVVVIHFVANMLVDDLVDR